MDGIGAATGLGFMIAIPSSIRFKPEIDF